MIVAVAMDARDGVVRTEGWLESSGVFAGDLVKQMSEIGVSRILYTDIAVDGTLARIHHALYVACREAAGRQASPTAAIIDSQSVKSAEKGGVGSIRRALIAAKRSRARNGTSWSTRTAC